MASFGDANVRNAGLRGSLWLRHETLRFHKDEDGKISLVTTVAVLALVALAGFIGNIGDVVGKKIETQNAADGIAVSSASWMARGMNAVTATNHMIGEASAMSVIHESLGGPSLDNRLETPSPESQLLNSIMTSFENTSPIGIASPGVYGERIFTAVDRRIVSAVVDLATDDQGRHAAGATLYDSLLTLKREQAVLLPIKTLANVGFLVPPPFGYATAAAAYAAHTYATVQLVLIGKEYLVLDALEKAAIGIQPLKDEVIELQLVPTLVEHAKFVSGWTDDASEQEDGIVNGAVERVVQTLTDEYGVETTVYPEPEKIRLPVEPEPDPSMTSGATLEAWGDDDALPIPDIPGLNDLTDALDDARGKLTDQVTELVADQADLQEVDGDLDELLEDDALTPELRQQLLQEKQDVRDALDDIVQEIQEANTALGELDQQQQDFADLEQQLQNLPETSDNPSIAHLPQQMNQGEEQYTQWVRATYPYVDAMRSPIVSQFKTWLPKSKADEHLIKWSNRYTLVKAWQFRSGQRFERTSSTSGEWQDAKDPLQMLVMRDSVSNPLDRSGEKGTETWTESSTAGKRMAEELFTVMGMAQRDYRTLFSAQLFQNPNQNGMTAVSQAIVYNANQQESTDASSNQPLIGWDTLNWNPEFATPEWGTVEADSPARWPWQVLSTLDMSDSASVQLNWQAKLMPVTETRLSDVSEEVSGDVKQNVDFALEYFDRLFEH